MKVRMKLKHGIHPKREMRFRGMVINDRETVEVELTGEAIKALETGEVKHFFEVKKVNTRKKKED